MCLLVRERHWVSCSTIFILVPLRQDLSLNLSLADSQLASEILLSVPSKVWGSETHGHGHGYALLFRWALGI